MESIDITLASCPSMPADFLRHLEDNPGSNVLASKTNNKHIEKAQRLLLEVSCVCA